MNETILVVDDEREIADLLEIYLKNDGYTVHTCATGAEAAALRGIGAHRPRPA